MARETGGAVTWVTVTCMAAGGVVGLTTGQVWLGIFSVLECNDILAPTAAG